MQPEHAQKKQCTLIHLPTKTLHDIASHLDIDSLAYLSLTCCVLHGILSEQLMARCSVILDPKRSELSKLSQEFQIPIRRSGNISHPTQDPSAINHRWNYATSINTYGYSHHPVITTIRSIIELNSIYMLDEFLRGDTRAAILTHLQLSGGYLIYRLMFKPDYQPAMIRCLVRNCDIPWLALITVLCRHEPRYNIEHVFAVLIRDNKLPINEQFDHGHTALHIAVQVDSLAITSILLSLGANDRLVDQLGFTPLHLAVLRGNRDIARLLLTRQEQTDICEWPQSFPTQTVFSTIVQYYMKDGMTPLHMAACVGDISDIRLFCQYTFGCHVQDDKYKTPLWYAATNRHKQTVAELLRIQRGAMYDDERRAIVCAREVNWRPPLELIMYEYINQMQQERAHKKAKQTQDGDKSQVTTLLIHLPPETLHNIAGCLDIDSLACLSFTCRILHDTLSEQLIARCNAIIYPKSGELDKFLQHSKGKAASSGKYSDVLTKIYSQWDMFRGFDTYTCNTVNITIMSIINVNSVYVLNMLLHGETRDAIIKHLQKRAWGLVRPLTLTSHIPMIRYLIRKCDIPWLAYAALCYDDYTQETTNDIFKMLIQDIKLPINECFKLGQTALHLAVQAGNLEVTKALLGLGANDRLVNCLGLTPLHMAVLHGYRDIASLLLDRYDKMDICKWPQGFSTTTVFSVIVHRLVKEGTTPLHIAACAGNIYEVHLFHTYIDNYFAKDDKHKTPLWYAATNRHKIVTEYLIERHEGVTLGNECKAMKLAVEENWKPPFTPVTYSNHIFVQH